MFTTPIDNKNWRYFLRALSNTELGRPLLPHSVSTLQEHLTAPATIAFWIKNFAPHLAERDAIHIVVAGAAFGQDSVDDGRWYQFIPAMLGKPTLKVSVDLVGKELSGGSPIKAMGGKFEYPSKPMPSRLAAVVKGLPPAGVFGMELGEYLTSRGNDATADLIFMFHPGFQVHSDEWLLSGDMRIALSASIPIGAAAFAVDEYVYETWLLNEYGYGVEGLPLENPFQGNSPKDTPIPMCFAKLIWKLSSKFPVENIELTDDALEKIKMVEAWLETCVKSGNQYPPDEAFGQRVLGLINADTGDQANFVGLPCGLMVDMDNGSILELNSKGAATYLDIIVPDELIEQYPDDSALDYEKTIWSVEVTRFVENECNATQDESELEGLFGIGEGSVKGLQDALSQLGGLFSQRPVLRQTPGSGPFFKSIAEKKWSTAEGLIAAQPSLAHAVDQEGKTALFHVLPARNFAFAERLLAANSDPTHQDNEGFTPLHDASQQRNTEAAALLLKWHANPDVRSNMGWSPLLTALTADAQEVAVLLIEADADLHQPNYVGMSPASIYDQLTLSPKLTALIEGRLAA